MPGSENSTGKFHYVYVLESIIKSGELYIGCTENLVKRFREHNTGLNFSTKPYRPWKLIHYESYRSEKDVSRREKYLKTSQGSRLLGRMLKEYFYSRKR